MCCKKIGIMTLSSSDNCGSLLQCYALKKLLEPFGEVEVINFSSDNSHKMYDLPKVKFKTKLRSFLNLKKGQKYHNFKKSKEHYRDFRIKYLKIATNEIFPPDLKSIADKYDIVIAGSDQIWNVQMFDFDDSFFLGWTNSKKVAYAPSLGGRDIRIAKNSDIIVKLLNDFDFISVREEVGKNCLEAILNKDITKVLDPTLCLDVKHWEDLIGAPIVSGDYIFYYSWAYCDEDCIKIVSDESQNTGLPAYVLDSRKWYNKDEKKYGFTLSPKEGPLAFLNLMYYAKKVYVESFHGMIFAYLFKKNFYILDTHENLSELDSRLAELVELFGLKDRIITKYNYNYLDLTQNINYADNSKLNNLRTISQEYLKEAMR